MTFKFTGMFLTFCVSIGSYLHNLIQSGGFSLTTFSKNHRSPFIHVFNLHIYVILRSICLFPYQWFVELTHDIIVILNYRKIWSWLSTFILFFCKFCFEFRKYFNRFFIWLISEAKSKALRVTLNRILSLFSSKVQETVWEFYFLPKIHHFEHKKLFNFCC